MIAFSIFFIGLVFGSFISMASYRLIKGGSFLGRSNCPKCKHKLSTIELFPLFSYLAQHGKCRNCKKHISIRYPIIEASTGIIFFLISLQYQNNLLLMGTLCLIAVGLLILIVTDFENYIIPNEIQIYLSALSIVYNYQKGIHLLAPITFAIFAYGLGIILQKLFKYIMKKDGLGYGDVKFFGVAGLYLDLQSLSLFFMMSGILGIIIAKIWINMGLGKRFPFGPALAISLFICILYPELAYIIYRE